MKEFPLPLYYVYSYLCPQPHRTYFGEVNVFEEFWVFIREKGRRRCVRVSRVLVHLSMRCGRCHRQPVVEPSALELEQGYE